MSTKKVAIKLESRESENMLASFFFKRDSEHFGGEFPSARVTRTRDEDPSCVSIKSLGQSGSDDRDASSY